MSARYQLPGWPAKILGHAAALPGMTRAAGSGAVQYKDGVTGRPGTAPVPAGGPGLPGGPVAQAMGGWSSSADYRPGPWFPQQWWARPERSYWPGAGMPVSVQSDNLLPIPATDPRGVQSVLAQALALRGAQQIKAVPTLTMWPSVNQ